jgi:hypothetical protein
VLVFFMSAAANTIKTFWNYDEVFAKYNSCEWKVKCKGSRDSLTFLYKPRKRSIHNTNTTVYPEAYKIRNISFAVKISAGDKLFYFSMVSLVIHAYSYISRPMEQDPSSEANGYRLVRKSPYFMETEGPFITVFTIIRTMLLSCVRRISPRPPILFI